MIASVIATICHKILVPQYFWEIYTPASRPTAPTDSRRAL